MPTTKRQAALRVFVPQGMQKRWPRQGFARMPYPPGRMRFAAARRGFRGLGFFGASDRYSPTPAQILPSPTQGAWYRIKQGETWWGVSKAAYGQENVKAGLMLLNRSTWNDHIERAAKDWEVYKVLGLQATPKYSSTNPLGTKGSGTSYPVAWIPPFDTGAEPESIYGPQVGPQGPPGVPGSAGTPGPMGPAGSPGPMGPAGPQGPAGVCNAAAIQSSLVEYFAKNPVRQGPVGPQGPIGPVGPRGEKGEPGQATAEFIEAAIQSYLKKNPIKQGSPGAMGPAGPRGEIGPQGIVGPIGPMGPPGPMGPAGKTIAGGGGEDKGLWALPLAAMFTVI